MSISILLAAGLLLGSPHHHHHHKRPVFLDPGHGREDTGAALGAKGAPYEYDVTYRVVERTREKLVKDGYQVFLTAKSRIMQPKYLDLTKTAPKDWAPKDARYTNFDQPVTAGGVGLIQRVHWIKDSKFCKDDDDQALFISCHVNAPGKDLDISGVSIFLDRRQDHVPRLASILEDLIKKAKIGEIYHGHHSEHFIHQEGLAILNPASNPLKESLLLEMGFPQFCKADYDLVITPQGEDQLADVIVKSIEQFTATD